MISYKNSVLRSCIFLLHVQPIPRHVQAICVRHKVSLHAVSFTSQYSDVMSHVKGPGKLTERQHFWFIQGLW